MLFTVSCSSLFTSSLPYYGNLMYSRNAETGPKKRQWSRCGDIETG